MDVRPGDFRGRYPTPSWRTHPPALPYESCWQRAPVHHCYSAKRAFAMHSPSSACPAPLTLPLALIVASSWALPLPRVSDLFVSDTVAPWKTSPPFKLRLAEACAQEWACDRQPARPSPRLHASFIRRNVGGHGRGLSVTSSLLTESILWVTRRTLLLSRAW